MMSNPPPRPALRRASDSDVSPARINLLPNAEANSGSESPRKVASGKKGKKSSSNGKALTIRLPKKLSKQLDLRATSLGYDPNDVVEMLVRGWLDG